MSENEEGTRGTEFYNYKDEWKTDEFTCPRPFELLKELETTWKQWDTSDVEKYGFEYMGTAPAKKNTITRAKKFYEGIGMKPLIVKKEIEGYISDRLQEALWREALHIIKDGIASTQDVDDAIVYGPGLRWSFMGVCLTFHLAGGQTGMKHMLEQFGPALKLPWTKLKAPKLDAKLKKLMISGTKKQAGKYTIKDLEVQRDIFLIEIMKTLNKYQRNNFPNWNKTFNKF